MTQKKEAGWLDQELLRNGSQRDIFISLWQFSIESRDDFGCNHADFVRACLIAAAFVAWSAEDLHPLTDSWDDLWTALDRHVSENGILSGGLYGQF